MPKSELDTDGHLPVCICVCGHLSVWDICLCVCVSVHMRVCGHLSVYTCVWTSVCMRVCGHLSVYVCVDICLYACVWTSTCHVCTCDCACVRLCVVCLCVCVDMCVRECVDGHVRASVCHYNFEMLMCTIFILTIIVQFEMDILYIMIWKVWYRGCAIAS